MIFGRKGEGSVQVQVTEDKNGKVRVVAHYFPTGLEKRRRAIAVNMDNDLKYSIRSKKYDGLFFKDGFENGAAIMDVWAIGCHWERRKMPKNLRQVKSEADKLTHEFLWKMKQLRSLRHAYSVLKRK